MDRNEHESVRRTKILAVDVKRIGDFIFHEPEKSFLADWDIKLSKDSQDAQNLLHAVEQLHTSSLPVAFPTETVYGLGADATRSDAVAGIYTAKQRPADNPLIVHISSLRQLRRLLTSTSDPQDASPNSGHQRVQGEIPAIYDSLIARFWPGPLSILLPCPEPSPLAPAVTASLSTFGVRMPSSRLALALIHLADLPLAAPSANASTKPSPTTAAHVLQDLDGRIDLIIDGGPCLIGIESTVVDGLTSPPAILRPGGISIEMIRQCPGWEHAAVAYGDSAETIAPRAPGMKYKHYSPKARVILVHGQLRFGLITSFPSARGKVGLVSTLAWRAEDLETPQNHIIHDHHAPMDSTSNGVLHKFAMNRLAVNAPYDWSTEGLSTSRDFYQQADTIHFSSIDLGNEAAKIAHGLFAALRELDLDGVDVIFVEAINETEGDAAAAVMNRLRKAAEMEVNS
ncbi:MAG: hypothetical protein Q9169_005890 [Polycauliona sp. 2 TL-2023]